MPKNRDQLNDDEKARRLSALAASKKAKEEVHEEEDQEEEDQDQEEDQEDDESGSGGDDESEGGESDDGSQSGDADGGESAEAGKDDEDQEDEKPGNLSPEEERRQRKRQEKKERRERARAAREGDRRLIESLTNQLREQNNRLAGLEKNNHQSTVASLDDAISREERNFQLATQKMADAVKKGDDKAFAAAVTARDESRDRWLGLKNNKTRLQALEQRAGRPSMPKPAVLEHAKRFADEHKWYDVQGNNDDSKIVLAIDESLVKAGFDPETPQYWQELRTRAKKYLPHRFQAGGKTGPGAGKSVKGKPGQFGAGMRSGSKDKPGAVLSKARQQALEALGLERGTPEWQEHVKMYQTYDKTQAANQRR